jgi:single-strand DNA-binding protein
MPPAKPARRAGHDDEPPARGRSADTASAAAHNEVSLRGRVAAAPVERELPSGDSVITARIIVDREGAAAARSSQRVDTIDCVAWTVRVQRSVRLWEAGDEVEVRGSIRRRFYRAADGPRSRFEVEIAQAKRLRRG